MIDLDALQERPLDKVRNEAGYTCSGCKEFQRVYITTKSLNVALTRIKTFDTKRGDFLWHFGKTLKKALSTQRER